MAENTSIYKKSWELWHYKDKTELYDIMIKVNVNEQWSLNLKWLITGNL